MKQYYASACGQTNGCGDDCWSGRPIYPMPCCCNGSGGTVGPAGPAGVAATSENAMLYNEAAQTIASGGTLAFSDSQINSTGSIAPSGSTGLVLTEGQYLINFVSDAETADAGNIAVALAINGDTLGYTETVLSTTGNQEMRDALNTILDLAEGSTLTVQNTSDSSNTYTNSVLTAVKLA